MSLKSYVLWYISFTFIFWGVATKTLMEIVFLLQKRASRAINKTDYLYHIDPLFSELKILNLDDLYSSESYIINVGL